MTAPGVWAIYSPRAAKLIFSDELNVYFHNYNY